MIAHFDPYTHHYTRYSQLLWPGAPCPRPNHAVIRFYMPHSFPVKSIFPIFVDSGSDAWSNYVWKGVPLVVPLFAVMYSSSAFIKHKVFAVRAHSLSAASMTGYTLAFCLLSAHLITHRFGRADPVPPISSLGLTTPRRRSAAVLAQPLCRSVSVLGVFPACCK